MVVIVFLGLIYLIFYIIVFAGDKNGNCTLYVEWHYYISQF